MFAWGMALFTPFLKIPAAHVDIVLEDQAFSLSTFGIAGKILHTPGHSPGSVSVVLNTGDAFVGDLVMNAFSMCLRPSLPIFAEDIPQVKNSLKLLLAHGVKTIYPAHGHPFPIEALPINLW
jgi:glyoxylase-like metal-dependent hydrolase (beta-lactamase superfamily II)